MSAEAHVIIDALEKTFGRQAAVKNVSVTVPKGECLVLLGPSGCGKTTTLRCVAGFEAPDRGRIIISGQTVFDAASGLSVPPARRDIGMVFQSYAIWPHMTVFENVAFPLRIRRISRSEIAQRVERILALVGLAGLEGRNASALSGGQMQRVAVARSLIYEPSLLLLDEPLSNLDAVLRERLRFEIKSVLKNTSTTAIYVTHDQTEAVVLGDQIAVMNAGMVAQRGTGIEIFTRPADRFVAEFIGATNHLAGTLVNAEAGLSRLQLGNGDILLAIPSTALVNPGAYAGSRCLAVFRPESVVLSRDRPAVEPNTWQGTVIEARYLGTHTAYTLESSVGELIARIQEPRPSFASGQSLWFHVPSESTVLLAGDAEQTATGVKIPG